MKTLLFPLAAFLLSLFSLVSDTGHIYSWNISISEPTAKLSDCANFSASVRKLPSANYLR